MSFTGKIARTEMTGHGDKWHHNNLTTYSFTTDTSREQAWERVLYAEDPFQTPHSMREVPASLIQSVPPEETELALVTVNRAPMFVQLPTRRIGEDRKVKLTWEELRLLGDLPNGSNTIRLD